MSHDGNRELKRSLYEDALKELEEKHPEVHPSQIEERFGEKAKEMAEDYFYNTPQGNPTLSAAERNR
tara:strand:+ start:2378 stop:2578 length:201 start_codon:yes stop_codon:yes gene_type:complete